MPHKTLKKNKDINEIAFSIVQAVIGDSKDLEGKSRTKKVSDKDKLQLVSKRKLKTRII